MHTKVGVLLPGSGYIPSIGKDIKHALCLGLDENSKDSYDLIIETTLFNAEKAVVISKIHDMLIKHDIDIFIAPLNLGILEYVAPIFSEHEVPLLAITLGEDVLDEKTIHPYLFVNSMNLWQSSWLSGYWGTESFGKRVASALGYHEAGYGMSFAFALGVEAQNGSIVQTTVTHVNSSTEDPTEKLAEIAETEPDFVMGFYSGKEAKSFLSTFVDKKISPLISTSYCLSKSLLTEFGDKLLGIPSISSWNIETVESKAFEQKYVKETGKTPHAYALLAYEAGLMLSTTLKDNNQQLLVDNLRSSQTDGPRGKLSFDKNTQTVQTKDYLYEVAIDSAENYHHKLVKELTLPPLFNEQFTLARRKIAKQGWLNPYLIA